MGLVVTSKLNHNRGQVQRHVQEIRQLPLMVLPKGLTGRAASCHPAILYCSAVRLALLVYIACRPKRLRPWRT